MAHSDTDPSPDRESTPRLPAAVVGDAYTSDHAWSFLEDLVDIGNRMAGQAGEREGAELVVAAFEDIGLREVGIEEFELPGWWRGESALHLETPRERTYDRQHEVLALPGTPSGAAGAPIVDTGYGVPADFGTEHDVDGKIAMARSDSPEDHDRWIHRMEKYAAAADAGAVGFVFRNHIEGTIPPTGEVGYHNRPGPIPAVGVSKELGERIARYAEDGPVEAELEVDCRNEPTTAPNPQGVVGPDTDEEVLVTAHVDAHDIAEGANDNGSGTALVVEIARLLKAAEDELDTAVRCMPFGAEEVGLYGAYHHAATTDPDSIKAVLNIDGAGGSRTPVVRTNTFESLEAPFRRAADRVGVPIEFSEGASPHGDQWAFAERGVPAAMCGSKSESSGRGWGHTHADTLDKLDRRDLRAIAVVYAEAAIELADAETDLPHRSPAEIREEVDESYEQELRAGGRWHFDELAGD